MAIDTSMYGRLQAPDIVGGIEQGMRLADMMGQRREKQQLKDAYKAGLIQNPDGTTSIDQGKTFAALAGVNPMEAQEYQRKMQVDKSAQIENQFKQASMVAQLTAGVKDQSTYDSALGEAQKMGLDVSGLPPQYDPGMIETIRGRALTIQDRLAQQNRDRQFQMQEKELISRALDRKEARDERRFQHGIQMNEKVQALKTPFGLANTVDDAKQLKSAFEAKKDFDDKLDEMISLREKHGGGAILNREDVARGKQLSKDLLLAYKDMAKLGVLSKADEDILRAIIPDDPLQYNSPIAAIQGQDPTLHRLRKFRQDSERDFSTRVGTRTRAGVESVAKRGPPRTEAPPKDDYDNMSDEQIAELFNSRVSGSKNANSR